MLLAAVCWIAPLDERLGLQLGFLGSTLTMLVIAEQYLEIVHQPWCLESKKLTWTVVALGQEISSTRRCVHKLWMWMLNLNMNGQTLLNWDATFPHPALLCQSMCLPPPCCPTTHFTTAPACCPPKYQSDKTTCTPVANVMSQPMYIICSPCPYLEQRHMTIAGSANHLA